MALERDGTNGPLESLEFKVRAEDRACWKTPPQADSSQWSRHNSPSDTTPHANRPLKYMMTAQRPVTHSDRPDTKQLWGHYLRTHRGSCRKIEKTSSTGWVWNSVLTPMLFVDAKMLSFSHVHVGFLRYFLPMVFLN